MKKALLILAFCFAAVPAWALPQTKLIPVDHDPFMVWKKSKNFETVKRQGAQTVFMPEEKNFFSYYIPKNFKSGRVMVGVHGTGGSPYEELKDEIAWADKFDYAIVAMNWLKREKTGKTPEYLTARDLYRNILEALDYLQKQSGSDLSRVAYIGFSRGSAVSYELAYLDGQDQKIFDLFISHSGGIPLSLKVEAKNNGSQPDKFFYDLTNGKLGEAPMRDAKFFLYSGDKDEQWGASMSQQMDNAKKLIEKNGGEVVEWVRDPEGGHMGLRKNKEINEKAIRWFLELTP